MNRRFYITLILIFFVSFSLFSNTISFLGGESSLSLKEGQKSVSLSKGARVETGSITITSDEMTLSGEDWCYVECTGNVLIKDTEKNIEIRSSSIWYDRIKEIIIISSWFEIDDTSQELYATAGSLHYDMKNEKLELSMQVSLMRISDGSVMTCTSESLSYDRENEFVSLKGKSNVIWKGDEYSADIISVDLKNDEISLSGRIKGTING